MAISTGARAGAIGRIAGDGLITGAAGASAVPRQHAEQLVDVVAQPFGRDGRIFDKRNRLGIALLGHRQTEGGSTKLPGDSPSLPWSICLRILEHGG